MNPGHSLAKYKVIPSEETKASAITVIWYCFLIGMGIFRRSFLYWVISRYCRVRRTSFVTR